MPLITSNFTLNSKLSNFTRDSFDTLQDMRSIDPAHIDEGHISYCKENNKHYVFNSKNVWSEETGYFLPLITVSTDNTTPDNMATIVMVFDTLQDMLANNKIGLGQLAYCKETKNHYFYAYDSTLDDDSLEQIIYDEETGYFRKVNSVDEDLCTIYDKLSALEESDDTNTSNISTLIDKVMN